MLSCVRCARKCISFFRTQIAKSWYIDKIFLEYRFNFRMGAQARESRSELLVYLGSAASDVQDIAELVLGPAACLLHLALHLSGRSLCRTLHLIALNRGG